MCQTFDNYIISEEMLSYYSSNSNNTIYSLYIILYYLTNLI